MKKILYISYDGMTDNLGQSQVIPYLKGLSYKGFEFTILSFEKQGNFEKNKTNIEAILTEANIKWEPRKYTSSPPVLSTLKDIWVLLTSAKKLHKTSNFDLVHCRSYISAFGGLYLKRKFGVKFVFDMRGFWADERVEGNIWKLNNPLFKLIFKYFKKQEIKYLNYADYTISLTETGKNEILSWIQVKNNPIPIEVIPCCADFDHFKPCQAQSLRTEHLKKELEFSDTDFIISYLGSVGTWYMLDEMLDFFSVLQKHKPEAKFLFISPDHENTIKDVAIAKGINPNCIIVKSASRADVPAFIALSTISLFFIKSVFSKKASSPTKMAEIMGMGIPIICNTNVGDVEQIINETQAGITIKAFTENEYNSAVMQIDNLLKLNDDEIRQSAIEWFSLEVGVERYEKVYRKVLSIE